MVKNVVFILFFLPIYVYGQRKVLDDCQLMPQQRSKWCWAASIKMVNDYLKYPDTLAQCEIAKLNPGLVNGIDTSTFCNSLCFDIKRHGNATLNANDYEMLLNQLNINSKTKQNILSWSDIVKLIDKKSPFLLSGLYYKDFYQGTGSHVVVSNGYLETTDNHKWLHILDPYNPYGTLCQGCEYWIPYCNLLKKDTGNPAFCETFANGLKVIYNLQVKGSDAIIQRLNHNYDINNCKIFADKTKNDLLDGLFAYININDNAVKLFPKISQSEWSRKEFKEYKVYDLSYQRIIKINESDNIKLDDILVQDVERSIYASTINPELQLVIIKYQNCDLYLLESIGGRCFDVNKLPKTALNATVEIIRTPPYPYAFIKKTTYKWTSLLSLGKIPPKDSEIKNVSYLPLNDYPELMIKKEGLNEQEFIKLITSTLYKDEQENFK